MSYECTPEEYAAIDRKLAELELPRTRKNVIIWLFGEVPEEWNDEREGQLPPDLQVWPAPHYALGN